ncbi:MAG: DUF4212 domain-containing protein [Bacteroidales bacterium]
MEKKKQEYHTSFFKPSNKRTKANRNMVIWLVSVWAVAVFGFQILLKVLEKPTPEPDWETYQTIKASVYTESATTADYRKFARVNLSVLAKIFITPDERERLQKSMSWAFFNIAGEEGKHMLSDEISKFKAVKDTTSDVMNPVYQDAKFRLQAHAAPMLQLMKSDVRIRKLPLELRTDYPEQLSPEQIRKLENILDAYLIHNRSVLTDTIVLGFPFHYFYTAVLLLILFVVLCWLYCITADSQNKKHNIQD